MIIVPRGQQTDLCRPTNARTVLHTSFGDIEKQKKRC